jgi:hypothetical protein
LKKCARFQIFLDEIRIAAIRALLGDRPGPRHEIAIGVTVTAVKRLAALGSAFDYFAFRAFRAVYADCFLFHVFAGRVVAAGREFSESAVFLDQIIAALRTFFIQLYVGFFLRAADLLRGLAVGIAGAGVKRPESALL